MEQLYLSRRNLLVLLSKLDRKAKGEETACTLIKNDTEHPTYPCSSITIVTAIEDKDYYTDRTPGPVHSSDEQK
jgi:hypothetical protein